MAKIRPGTQPRPLVSGVGISSADRPVFPTVALTKLDVARYFQAISAWMLPHVEGRPLTLVHCPKGVPAGGARKDIDCVFMKHSKLWTWTPQELRRVRILEETKFGDYFVADSVEALVVLAQMDVLEVHTWNSRVAHVDRPDRIVIDLDPGSRVSWTQVVTAARLVREFLTVLELDSFVKTTGGRGLHVVVPIEPTADWSECLAFARALALTLARQDRIFTARLAKADREDRIFVDYLRNNRTNTSVAAYSTRANPAGTVSMPLSWAQLKTSISPDDFTIPTVLTRIRRQRSDSWAGYGRVRQRLSRHAVAALERLRK